jgi:hypothetical protein
MSTAAIAISMGVMAGASTYSAVSQSNYNKKTLKEQKRALTAEQEEIERQKKREQEQQRRENMQLMNTVSGLTNTSYSGVSSPSIDYDKYGDLG